MMNEIDVAELSHEQLMKSSTYQKFHNQHGRCSRCKEMTSLLSPCCDTSVEFEGSTEDADELWNKIEQELKDRATPDYDAQAKDDSIDFGGDI